MAEICASLLAANHGWLIRDMKKAEESGVCRFHIDVCDGHYTENIIFGDQLVRSLREETDAVLDVHLAVLNMPSITLSFMDSGADVITVQYESAHLPSRLIRRIQEAGKQAGICFIPATGFPVMEYFLEEADVVNILAVDPGIGGQKFQAGILKKVEKTADYIQRNHLTARISVDGGVLLSNFSEVRDAGADIIILGSGIFSGDIAVNLEKINSLNNGRGEG